MLGIRALRIECGPGIGTGRPQIGRRTLPMPRTHRAGVKSIDGPCGDEFVAPAKAPEPRFRPPVDAEIKLDSGLRRNDVPGLMLCPNIFEHRPLKYKHISKTYGGLQSSPRRWARIAP